MFDLFWHHTIFNFFKMLSVLLPVGQQCWEMIAFPHIMLSQYVLGPRRKLLPANLVLHAGAVFR